MINENSIDNFNTRLTFDYSKVKELTPQQKDKIRNYGSQAESLMKNRDLAMFIHHHKFDIFVNSLKRAVYLKTKVGNSEIEPGTL